MPKATILLIDDEDQLRGLLAQLLELENYQVLQASTLRQGLQLLERTPQLSLILTDVRLPDGNGLTLLEKVKNFRFEGEVIVMTAYGTIQDGVKAMKQGAFDYVVKGDHDEQMLLTVEKAVEKSPAPATGQGDAAGVGGNRWIPAGPARKRAPSQFVEAVGPRPAQSVRMRDWLPGPAPHTAATTPAGRPRWARTPTDHIRPAVPRIQSTPGP